MSHRRPLQGLVDATEHFGRLPVWAVLGFALGVAGLVGLIWRDWGIGLGFGLFASADGALLAALPRFERSYGPLQLPWLGLTALRLTLALASFPLLGGSGSAPLLHGLAQGVVWLVAAYACWIEPFRLGVTRITLRSRRFNGCPPLRLLHISDLHLERVTVRERRLLHLTRQLSPDVIVVTGDYLNISYTHDGTAQAQAREWLGQLGAPGGVYAIKGSPTVDPPEVVARVLEGLELTWLRDEVASLNWHGCRLNVVGVECSYDIEADEDRLRGVLDGRGDDAFTLLLYHTPDVMPAAAAAGVDLYLAGHTHGGQLRLPLFGALVTASIYGKRYEMGRYREAETTLYVSRGVGMEGKGAPRARFLCPPEIVLFTLTGEKGTQSPSRAQRRNQNEQGRLE